MQDAFAYCAELVRTADRDRYLAALFAPAEHRGALYALYAFNVEIGRACARWRASRCRAKSACNGGARFSAASGAGRRPPIRSQRRCCPPLSGMGCRQRAARSHRSAPLRSVRRANGGGCRSRRLRQEDLVGSVRSCGANSWRRRSARGEFGRNGLWRLPASSAHSRYMPPGVSFMCRPNFANVTASARMKYFPANRRLG